MLPKRGDDFFHPSLCHICKAIKELMKCGKCKSVSYCSKEHQLQDWPRHKEFCKHITAVDRIFTVQMQNIIGNRRVYVSMMKDKLLQKMNRNILNYESDIVVYRKYCAVCNDRNCTTCCEACLSVFYCSPEHQNTHNVMHNKFCSNFKLNLDLLINNFKNKIFFPKFTGKPLANNIKQLPEKLLCLLKFFKEESYVVFDNTLNDLQFFTITDMLSPVGSIIFALEKANLIENRLLFKKNLVVHVVRSRETIQDFRYFQQEFFYHWITNLEKLTVIVTEPNGPNINPFIMNNISFICRSCKMSHKNTKCYIMRDHYQNVIDDIEKPDIVVTFNSEMFLCSSWIQYVPSLLKYPNVPLILTDFSLENIEKDLKTVEHMAGKNFDVILTPQENPFCCISPQRNGENENCPIYFNNKYITVLSAKHE